MSALGDLIRSTLTDEMWEHRRRWHGDDASWFGKSRTQHREDTIAVCRAVAAVADEHPEAATVFDMAMRGLIRRDVCQTVEMQLVACQPWLAKAAPPVRGKPPRPPRRPGSRSLR
jgi:hypothetical protein